MNEDEDQVWLDALAGRSSNAPSRIVDREARALRELIGAQLLENPVDVAEVDSLREAELLERARAEDLLPPARARAEWTPRRRRPAFMFGGVLAAALLASVVIGVYRMTLSPTETYRGLHNGAIRLESMDPAALKRQLLRELQDAGAPAVGYDRLGRQGIDAELPQPVSTRVQEVLQRHHIPIPDDGALVIEIDAAGRP